jgi:hypothetical protein
MGIRWADYDPPRFDELKPRLWQRCYDESGEIVGSIQRLFDDGPTYAHTACGRSGAMESDAAAMAWVERKVRPQ